MYITKYKRIEYIQYRILNKKYIIRKIKSKKSYKCILSLYLVLNL